MAMPTDISAWRRRVHKGSYDMHALWREAGVRKTFAVRDGEDWDDILRKKRRRLFKMRMHHAVMRILSTQDGPPGPDGDTAMVSGRHPFAHEQPRHGTDGFRYGYINKPGATYTVSHCDGTSMSGEAYYGLCVRDGISWSKISIMPNTRGIEPRKFRMHSAYMVDLVCNRPDMPAFQIHLQAYNVTFALRDPYHAWFTRDKEVALRALFGQGSVFNGLPHDLKRIIYMRLRDAEFNRRVAIKQDKR